jgi:hypothetical protein
MAVSTRNSGQPEGDNQAGTAAAEGLVDERIRTLEIKAPFLTSLTREAVKVFKEKRERYTAQLEARGIADAPQSLWLSMGKHARTGAKIDLMDQEVIDALDTQPSEQQLEAYLGSLVAKVSGVHTLSSAQALIKRKVTWVWDERDPKGTLRNFFARIVQLEEDEGLAEIWGPETQNSSRKARLEAINGLIEPYFLQCAIKEKCRNFNHVPTDKEYRTLVSELADKATPFLCLAKTKKWENYLPFTAALAKTKSGKADSKEKSGKTGKKTPPKKAPTGKERATGDKSETDNKEKTTRGNTPPSPCPVCAGDHWKSDCPEKNNKIGAVKHKLSQEPSASWEAYINGTSVASLIKLDSESDLTLVSEAVLEQMDSRLATYPTKAKQVSWVFSGSAATLDTGVTFNLKVQTGKDRALKWSKLKALVVPKEMIPGPEIWLSKFALREIGLDLYEAAAARSRTNKHKRAKKNDYRQAAAQAFDQVDHTQVVIGGLEANTEDIEAAYDSGGDSDDSHSVSALSEANEALEAEIDARFVDVEIGDSDAESVKKQLVALVHDTVAVTPEITDQQRNRLIDILIKYADCFRENIGKDPPIDVAPMKILPKDGFKPFKHRARVLSPEKRNFLEKHMAKLVKFGLLKKVTQSRMCSPCHVVRKPSGKGFRLALDLRKANQQVHQLVYPLPNLEKELIRRFANAKYMSSFDAFKGFWQILLDPQSQELHTIVTEQGLYQPTRMPQGSSSSAQYWQAVMHDLFGELIDQGSMVVYIDDLCIYTATLDEHLDVLEKVLEICRLRRVKLNVAKIQMLATSVRWCGRVISSEGIRYDEDFVQGLVDCAEPKDGGQLVQFIAAMGWMRTSIHGFAALVGPLVRLRAEVFQDAKCKGKQTKKAASRVSLEGLWTQEHTECFNQCKEAIKNNCALFSLREGYTLCLFTDASDEYWASVLTQVPDSELELPLEEQHHLPISFLSGKFSSAQQEKWDIAHKEAFGLMASVERLRWLLEGNKPFRLYGDNRNVQFIFKPADTTNLDKNVTNKITRWAISLQSLRFEHIHIPSDCNVIADLLSRIGIQPRPPAKIGALIMDKDVRVRPLHHSEFVWPSLEEIRQAQEAYLSEHSIRDLPVDTNYEKDRAVWVLGGTKRIWVPDIDSLPLRLMVIAHHGTAAHIGTDACIDVLKSRFYFQDMTSLVTSFCRKCLHCAPTRGGKVVPRPLGNLLRAENPFELIHFDYVSIYKDPFKEQEDGEPLGSLLVVKDDFSHFTWLVPVRNTDAYSSAKALLDWQSLFKFAKFFNSDRGSHFANEVMDELAKLCGTQHRFTPVYSAWSNGIVESKNRTIRQALGGLLSEHRVPMHRYTEFLPVVQKRLNHCPSRALGNHSPFEVLFGIPSDSPLDFVLSDAPAVTSGAVFTKLQPEVVDKYCTELRQALARIHSAVLTARQAQADRNRRAAPKGTPVNFDVNDFVLFASTFGRKLKWTGPYRVLRKVHPYLFEIESLVTGACRTVHATYLRFYEDSSLQVTAEIKAQAAHDDQGFVIEGFLGHRLVRNSPQLLVSWLGFPNSENSWEPAHRLFQDVPALLRAYVTKMVPSKVKTRLEAIVQRK